MDKPRYSRISDILDLATFMSSKMQGVTINEIGNRYRVSRRTAERMRDSLTNIFPSVGEIETTDTQKHWGFINYSISNLISFNKEEINTLENIIKQTSNKELKFQIEKTVEKIKAINNKNKLSEEEKYSLLMQTHGYAVKQVPKYKINVETFENVRNALVNSKMLEGNYHGKQRLIEPLGLIYGDKTYLIGYEKAKGKELYTYILHKFKDLKTTGKSFKKKDFNLQEYANRSFGVYQSEILNVKLEFSKELANEAMEYSFHPTQKIEKQKDGKLIVNFKACGDKEIIWHIFKWGKGCKILAPKSLKNKYIKYLKENLEANESVN